MSAYDILEADAAKHREVMAWVSDTFAPAVANAVEAAREKLGEEPRVTGWRKGAFLRLKDVVSKIGRAGKTAEALAKEAAK